MVLQDKGLSSEIGGVGRSAAPVVLIVDDDVACREEYASTISELGYICRSASDAKEALAQLEAHDDIGILLTDIRMPSIDGITLLHEVEARLKPRRHIVKIVVTAYASTDAVVSSMRAEAVDFLTKPLRREELSQALRRARLNWERENRKAVDSRLADLSDRIGAILQFVGGQTEATAQGGYGQDQYVAALKWLIGSRQKRKKFIGASQLPDASWDIILDLALAKFKGTPVAASNASHAADIPLTTALRRVSELVDRGYVHRRGDPGDRRRDLIELSEETFVDIKGYLEELMSHLKVDDLKPK